MWMIPGVLCMALGAGVFFASPGLAFVFMMLGLWCGKKESEAP